MMDKGHRQAFESQFPKPEGVVWSGSGYAAATDSPECAAAASQHRLVYRAWLCGGDWAFDEAAGAIGQLADSHAKAAGESRPHLGCDYQLAWDDAIDLIQTLKFHAATDPVEREIPTISPAAASRTLYALANDVAAGRHSNKELDRRHVPGIRAAAQHFASASPQQNVEEIESATPATDIRKARLALRQLEKAAGAELGEVYALACAEAIRAEIPGMKWAWLTHSRQRVKELERQVNRLQKEEAKRARLFRSWWDSSVEQSFSKWIGDGIQWVSDRDRNAAWVAWEHLHREVIFGLQNRIKHLEHINGRLNQDLRSKAQQVADLQQGGNSRPEHQGRPWTDEQCEAFMAVGLRHAEYAEGTSGPTSQEIREGVEAALAKQAGVPTPASVDSQRVSGGDGVIPAALRETASWMDAGGPAAEIIGSAMSADLGLDSLARFRAAARSAFLEAAMLWESGVACYQSTGICWCEACRPLTAEDIRMILCPDCGDKRCPRAANHRAPCAGIEQEKSRRSEMAALAFLVRLCHWCAKVTGARAAKLREIERYDEALAHVLKTRRADAADLRRHLSVDHNHACRLLEALEENGVIEVDPYADSWRPPWLPPGQRVIGEGGAHE